MIYNSFLYITLFPFLFLLLHAIKKEAIKKYFLLAISYALYYYYNQSLAAILLVVTLISYTSALLIEKNKGKERTNSTSNNRSKLIVYLGALLTTSPCSSTNIQTLSSQRCSTWIASHLTIPS